MLFILFLIFSFNVFAMQNFQFNPEDLSKINQETQGVQMIYGWKSLEREKDKYDFSQIEKDLKFLNSKNKKLWIQIQDRSFTIDNKIVPKYLENLFL